MRRTAAPAIVVALSTALSACGSSVPSSPKAARRAAIIAAALAQKSVHWTADDYELGGDHETQISADVSAGSGAAWVTWQVDAGSDGGKYHVMRVNRIFYVNGDSSSLRELFDLKSAQATRYAGRWISTRNGEGVTLYVADGLTLPSIVREYASAVRRTSARATGERLPVTFDKNPSQVDEISGTFSKWNEPVHVHAPAHSVAIAVVRRS
jgi:hypothetical protein